MWFSTPEIAYAVSATGKSGFAARALARLDTLRRADTPGGRATAGTEPTAEMIDRARSGDPDAFAAVFEAYGVDVLRVCRRILGDPESASDARSDVFLKVRRSLASYDSARPFRSWLLSVTSHHCIDRLRHRATERRIFADTELEAGELEGAALEDYYVTFLAGIFRSIRFGAASAHGRANMIRFNFFEEFGAFTRDEATGVYRADFEKMRQAIDALSEKILVLQGDGDYAGATEMVERMSIINASLQGDLDRLSDAGIPTDIIFEQGVEVLGLD